MSIFDGFHGAMGCWVVWAGFGKGAMAWIWPYRRVLAWKRLSGYGAPFCVWLTGVFASLKGGPPKQLQDFLQTLSSYHVLLEDSLAFVSLGMVSPPFFWPATVLEASLGIASLGVVSPRFLARYGLRSLP